MQPFMGYTIIILICLVVGLAAFGKVPERWYPYLLYTIGAGVLTITALTGLHLVGLDLRLEFYYAQLYSGDVSVLPLVDLPPATSIANILIAPTLGKIIPLLWVYKLVYPLLLALVPTILYYTFRQWLGNKRAFLAGFAFIAFPAFMMEVPFLARQIMAELFLALLLLLLTSSNPRLRYRIPLVAACTSLLALSHYSIALVSVALIGGMLLVRLCQKHQRRITGIALASIVITSVIYFPLIENGVVAIKVGNLYNTFAPKVLEIKVPPMRVLDQPRPPKSIDTLTQLPKISEWTPAEIFTPERAKLPLLAQYSKLMRIGFGSDFSTTTLAGKAFRVLQWIYLLLIPIGLWKLRRHKNYWPLAMGGSSLLVCLLIPGFASILNVTRIVHVALFLLVPTIAIALPPKYLLVVLIPYFLFTSGFVFEASQQPNIETVTTPYSVGLSNHRMDLGASTTKDDLIVRDYIISNKLFPVFSDLEGDILIGEEVGWRNDLNRYMQSGTPPWEGYIFVRSRNAQEGTFVEWVGIGCRRHVRFTDLGIDLNTNVLYQSGEARILGVKQ